VPIFAGTFRCTAFQNKSVEFYFEYDTRFIIFSLIDDYILFITNVFLEEDVSSLDSKIYLSQGSQTKCFEKSWMLFSMIEKSYAF
jgi:hypothetical protein